jgi:site-specific DNA recombinase
MAFPMQARLYERVSTDEQGRTGFSLAAQDESLRAFCVSQGWGVAGRYVDEGVSAKNLDRPEFQRLLRECVAGDVVLVYKLDRLTRSVRDLDDLLKEFDKRGIHFRSATEQFDTTTATGRLFIRMVAEFAQWERESIAERAAMGKHKRVKEGEWHGGKPPFGYVTVDSDKIKRGRVLKRLEPDPIRSHVVPMIFEKYVAGFGTRAIAIWLNDEMNVRTPTGKTFTSTAVSELLRNPTYCGDVIHGRVKNGDAMERVPGKHEPLVSREMFEEVQRIFALRRTLAPRHATGEYPLAGIARCGECGGTLSGAKRSNQKTKETGKTWRIYRCANHMRGRKCSDTPLHSVSAEIVEYDLVKQLEVIATEELRSYHEALEKQVEALVDGDVSEIDRLQSELDECKAAIDRWDAKYERGNMSEEEHEEKTRPIKNRMKAIQSNLAGLEAKVIRLPSMETMKIAFENVTRSWYGLSLEQRKTVVQALVESMPIEIVVHRSRRVEIRHSLPSRADFAHQRATDEPAS